MAGKTVWLSLLGFASVKNASKVFGVGDGEGAFFKKTLPEDSFRFALLPYVSACASKKVPEKFLKRGAGRNFSQKVPSRKSISCLFFVDKMRADAMGCERIRPHSDGSEKRVAAGRRGCAGEEEAREKRNAELRGRNGAEPRKSGVLLSIFVHKTGEPSGAPPFFRRGCRGSSKRPNRFLGK